MARYWVREVDNSGNEYTVDVPMAAAFGERFDVTTSNGEIKRVEVIAPVPSGPTEPATDSFNRVGEPLGTSWTESDPSPLDEGGIIPEGMTPALIPHDFVLPSSLVAKLKLDEATLIPGITYTCTLEGVNSFLERGFTIISAEENGYPIQLLSGKKKVIHITDKFWIIEPGGKFSFQGMWDQEKEAPFRAAGPAFQTDEEIDESWMDTRE